VNDDTKLDPAETEMAGQVEYPYMDQTRAAPIAHVRGDVDTPAVLNPAYYPASAKPEALHTEVEKAGAAFPTHAHPDDVEDLHQDGDKITEEERKRNPALHDPTQLAPGQIVIPPTHSTDTGTDAGKNRSVPAATPRTETKTETKTEPAKH
jgi:protein involved in polysaccharide export with SLBB domain